MRKPVCVSLDEDLVKWAVAAAAADGRSLSRLVEMALAEKRRLAEAARRLSAGASPSPGVS